MDKKRLLFALGFVVIAALIGYAIYRVFFKKPLPTSPATTPTVGPAGRFPQAGVGSGVSTPVAPPGVLPPSGVRPTTKPGIAPTTPEGSLPGVSKPTTPVTRVLDVGVKNAAPDASGGVKFYNQQDGKFYRLGKDGSLIAMSDAVFFNVEKVNWSPAKNESIIEYPDGANIYYNFDTKKQVTLPKHWADFSFSPLGDQLAAKSIGLSPDNRWLIAASPDGSNIKLVEPMGKNADKVTVDWSPGKQVVALSRTGAPLGNDRQEVLLVGLNKENFRSLVVEGRGLETQWSPTGGKILHSVYRTGSDYKPELWIADSAPDSVGGNRRLLSVNTWASKCAMSDDRFVYCGVPERMDTGAGFAPALADSTPDRLYKIDTVTGIKTEIPMESPYTINKIIVSAGGDKLYFTAKNQVGMFQVPIK